jgi:hypothetical protein
MPFACCSFSLFLFCQFWIISLLLADPEDPYTLTGETRAIGLTMCRGTTIMLIMPVDGSEELLENPFLAGGGAEQPVMDE